jgi:TonB family protein
MRSTPLAVTVVIGGLVLAVALDAQTATTPDFSGRWLLDPSRTTLTGAPLRILESPQSGSSAVTPPTKIKDVRPRYPQEAQVRRINGKVVMDVMIDATGDVVDLEILNSSPMFDDDALGAVAQWKYLPATKDGVPIASVMTVTVGFAIGRPSEQRQAGDRRNTMTSLGKESPPGSIGLGSPAEILSIEQDAKGLKISSSTRNGTDNVIYRFDGRKSENRRRTMGTLAAGKTMAFVSRWDASKLITDITWNSIVGPQRRAETMTVVGDTLVIELIRPLAPPTAELFVARAVYTLKRPS